MNSIQEIKELIAVSIYVKPCDENELFERDFLKHYAVHVLQRFIMNLEKDAIYYKGEKMFIYKKWAKKHLKSYELNL